MIASTLPNNKDSLNMHDCSRLLVRELRLVID